MKVLLSPRPPVILRPLIQSLAAPFTWLWLIVLIYYTASFLFVPHSQILLGNLPDTDDYMYLDQMIDWIDGQGWYDNIQRRLFPPAGTLMQFSHLAMVPMAALTLFFRLFGLSMERASLLMAGVYPLLLFAGCLITVQRVAAIFVPKRWSGASNYAMISSQAVIYLFQPGHIDHHGLIVWIVAMALGGSLLMMLEPEKLIWGILTGAALSVGMLVALETLPWVLVISGVLGLWAVVHGGTPARHALVFAGSQFGFSLFCLLIYRPISEVMTIDVINFSVVYVFLAAAILGCFIAVAATSRQKVSVRLVLGAAAAIICGGLFLWRFPDLLFGPYGGIDPDLNSLILKEANEAAPEIERMPDIFSLLAHVGSTLLAMFLAAWFLFRGTGPGRWVWGMTTAILYAAFALTMFYQSRCAGTMEMLKTFPLVAFLYHGWVWGGQRRKAEAVFFVRVAVVLLFVPLTGILIPYVTDAADYGDAGLLLYPAGSNSPNPCDMTQIAKVLNDPAGLGAQNHVIVADTWFGPELLFRTKHSVIAAPFLLNAAGTLDAFRFFATMVPDEAKTIMERHCVDLVLSCSTYPASYVTQPGQAPGTPPLHREFGEHFIETLMNETPPDWLREHDTFDIENFVLYEASPEVRQNFAKSCPRE